MKYVIDCSSCSPIENECARVEIYLQLFLRSSSRYDIPRIDGLGIGIADFKSLQSNLGCFLKFQIYSSFYLAPIRGNVPNLTSMFQMG